MRVSPCGWLARSIKEARCLAEQATRPSHDHPEAIAAAAAVAELIFLGRSGWAKTDALRWIHRRYSIPLAMPRFQGEFIRTAMETLGVAAMIVFHADTFEEVIFRSILLGGDTDTLAAVAGSIAEPWLSPPDAWVRDIRIRMFERPLPIGVPPWDSVLVASEIIKPPSWTIALRARLAGKARWIAKIP